MNKQINPIIKSCIVVFIFVFLFLNVFSRSSGDINDNSGVNNNPATTYVESIFKGIDRSPELATSNKKAINKTPKPSGQTLITVNNQTDLDSFLQSNGLSESDIQKSNTLPNTYIVNKPKNELNPDKVSLAERKEYKSLYDFSTQDMIYPQWYTSAIRADDIWAETTGTDTTTVAVIDTGFGLEHEDLEDRWADGGYDFYNNDSDPSAGTNNVNGAGVSHGTMVAGLIGATGDNGVGVASVNWKTKILPLQVLSDDGSGWTDDVAAAVNYAVLQDVDVINMSLGSSGYDPILEEAVENAIESGVTVVAAAGNCGASNYVYQGCSYRGEVLYPGAFYNVIAVGATDSNNKRADFSSYGSSVDVVAPGYGAIRSTMWANTNRTSSYNSVLAGTSFASPVVAGVIALKVGQDPTLSPAELRNQLILSANKVSGMGNNFFVDQYGYGLIDAFKLFHQSTCINDTHSSNGNGQQIISERHNAKKATTLWTIQRNNTNSYCEEAGRWNSEYDQWEHVAVTNVPTIESDSEKMLFADTNGDGASELIRIKYNNLSGYVVLNFWDNTLQDWTKQITTNLKNSNMAYGDIQAIDTNGNGIDELFYIKYSNTSSRKVEFYKWNSSRTSWSKKYISRLSARSKSKGTIIPVDFNGDRIDRFMYVRYSGSASKKVTMHTFSADFKTWTSQYISNLASFDSSQGFVVPSDVNGNRKDELNFVDRQTREDKVIIYRWKPSFKSWSEKDISNLDEY